MPRIPSTLTGSAGEHFVAYKLSKMGYLVALTRGGSPSVDLMVGDIDGRKTLSIQVKTTEWATRERGRGANRKPHHLQFPLGRKYAKTNQNNLFFAFVDLKGLDYNQTPDVYIVPSKFVFDFCKSWVDSARMVRFHIDISDIEPFKNNWDIFKKELDV